jgi:hypothetical protein
MGKTEVYYFSGTGNSLVLAKLVGRDDSQLGMRRGGQIFN